MTSPVYTKLKSHFLQSWQRPNTPRLLHPAGISPFLCCRHFSSGKAEKVQDSCVLFISYLAKSLKRIYHRTTLKKKKKISHGFFNESMKCLILLHQFSNTMKWFLCQMGQYRIIVQKLTSGHTLLKTRPDWNPVWPAENVWQQNHWWLISLWSWLCPLIEPSLPVVCHRAQSKASYWWVC